MPICAYIGATEDAAWRRPACRDDLDLHCVRGSKLRRVPAERKRSERLLERVRDRKERHRQRSRAYRATVVLVGILLVVTGFLLSAPGIPGPGLLVVAVGLGLLALEFDRAERLLERTVVRVDQLAEQATSAPPWQRGLLGAFLALAALAAVGAAVLWEIPFLPG